MADQLSTPAQNALALEILKAWRTERELLLALAFALERQLEPEDPENPQDSDNVTAWRLCQILYEQLTDSREQKFFKDLAKAA
jgi:hypothetical protein